MYTYNSVDIKHQNVRPFTKTNSKLSPHQLHDDKIIISQLDR